MTDCNFEMIRKLTCDRKNPQPDLFPASSSINFKARLLHLDRLNSFLSFLSLLLFQNLAGDEIFYMSKTYMKSYTPIQQTSENNTFIVIPKILVNHLLRSHLGSSPNPDTRILTRRNSLDGIRSFLLVFLFSFGLVGIFWFTDETAAVHTLNS